uniref:Uncharacterized protein n=1 Tax=Cannabis sativa TaxID=3483 RepID=A0A803QZ55_CANSA
MWKLCQGVNLVMLKLSKWLLRLSGVKTKFGRKMQPGENLRKVEPILMNTRKGDKVSPGSQVKTRGTKLITTNDLMATVGETFQNSLNVPHVISASVAQKHATNVERKDTSNAIAQCGDRLGTKQNPRKMTSIFQPEFSPSLKQKLRPALRLYQERVRLSSETKELEVWTAC